MNRYQRQKLNAQVKAETLFQKATDHRSDAIQEADWMNEENNQGIPKGDYGFCDPQSTLATLSDSGAPIEWEGQPVDSSYAGQGEQEETYSKLDALHPQQDTLQFRTLQEEIAATDSELLTSF